MLTARGRKVIRLQHQTPNSPGLGHRHVQTVIMFLGVTIAYALRVNLSVAIVAMAIRNPNTPHIQLIDITGKEKGLALSSFFMSYTILQVPAGILARKYGSCLQLSIAISLSGLITLLTPLATFHGGWIGLTIARIFIGLPQGFLYPCVNQHITKWAAPQERSRLFAFAFGGSQLGSIIMLPLGGYIASGPLGWPSIFYVSGSIAVLWGIVCGIFGANSPRVHKYISKVERDFIESSQINLSENDNMMVTPWREIFTSIPMWALILTYLSNIWGYWTLLTLMPSYIHGVLKQNIQDNGLLSALPYATMWIASVIYSVKSDWLINNNILSVQKSRKFWNTLSQMGPATCLIILAYIKPSVETSMIILTLSTALNAGMYVGYLMNPTDLSPNFTGTLIGITNGLSNISAILGPLLSSSIVTNNASEEQWRIVFLIAAVILIIGSIIFLIFGSAKVQPWNETKQNNTENTVQQTKL